MLFAGVVDSGLGGAVLVPLRTFPLLPDPLVFGGVSLCDVAVYCGGERRELLVEGCCTGQEVGDLAEGGMGCLVHPISALLGRYGVGDRRECHLGGGIDAI